MRPSVISVRPCKRFLYAHYAVAEPLGFRYAQHRSKQANCQADVGKLYESCGDQVCSTLPHESRPVKLQTAIHCRVNLSHRGRVYGGARAQVRDYMDPESKFQRTLCCLDKAHSFEARDECTDPSHAHAEGLRCMHVLHTNPNCATPTLNEENELPMYSYYDMSSDWEWIAEVRSSTETLNHEPCPHPCAPGIAGSEHSRRPALHICTPDAWRRQGAVCSQLHQCKPRPGVKCRSARPCFATLVHLHHHGSVAHPHEG